MRIDLSDDLCDRYLAHSATIPLAQLLERQLARFADYPATQRVLPLGPDALQQLEHLLGGGSIKSAADLVLRVRSYASISIGAITLDLTAAQKAEVQHRAEKRGITPKAVAEEMVSIIEEQIFETVTPYR
jgi:hypothetical protein